MLRLPLELVVILQIKINDAGFVLVSHLTQNDRQDGGSKDRRPNRLAALPRRLGCASGSGRAWTHFRSRQDGYPERMDLTTKYPGLMAAVNRPDEELSEDLIRAMEFIAANPNSDEAVRVGVVRNWIGQALRMRTPGLNGPLARAERPLVVRVPQIR